ncbi:hypothetical protein [Lignipirellula cremea]|uniref:Uncharacterized protein n=1 Tax=Lignipirellula cremea TaxID=2528010 RepID=A0A518E1F0_9BACT|nr:hypothetical protein [Lignipirellula cremea]QDU97926.1 hypothetical protein Pla8534_57850 [Lignipirellula cremea]
MRFPKRWSILCWMLLFSTMILGSNTGCVGLAAHAMYFMYGNTVPAEFDGLEGRRVAVLCVADSSPAGAGTASDLLARRVELLLGKYVKDIDVIPHSEVANWRDQNGDPIDYREIGKGVEAESLVVIELTAYSLQPSGTLYQGRATVNLTVYDMNKKGNIVWEDLNRDFAFPIHGGVHTSELSRNAFQQRVLMALSQDIVKHFYDYDFEDDFGSDYRSLH